MQVLILPQRVRASIRERLSALPTIGLRYTNTVGEGEFVGTIGRKPSAIGIGGFPRCRQVVARAMKRAASAGARAVVVTAAV